MKKNAAGEKSVVAFSSWCASMTDDEFRNIVFRGSLHRGEVAKRCGIAKAALRQNPQVKILLEQLESELRQRGILPPLPASSVVSCKSLKQHAMGDSKSSRDARRILELEQQVLELQARLKRFEELSEVLMEMGVEL